MGVSRNTASKLLREALQERHRWCA
jgi:hypothetical protein